MGLIVCPKCGELISEKAKECPRCSSSQNALTVCEDCETAYASELSACPKCGCPNFAARQGENEKKRKLRNALFLAAILAVLVALGVNAAQREKAAQYYKNMESAVYTMADGIEMAEKNGGLKLDVWGDAIRGIHSDRTDKYTMEDGVFVDNFNDALRKLYNDDDFVENASKIRSNKSEVTELMKELKNPPKKYKEAYRALKTYYDDYTKFVGKVLKSNGSYNSFSEEYKKYDEAASDSYEKMILYLE